MAPRVGQQMPLAVVIIINNIINNIVTGIQLQ